MQIIPEGKLNTIVDFEPIVCSYMITNEAMKDSPALKMAKSELGRKVPSHKLEIWGYNEMRKLWTLTYTNGNIGYIEVIGQDKEHALTLLEICMAKCNGYLFGQEISEHYNYHGTKYVLLRRAVIAHPTFG